MYNADASSQDIIEATVVEAKHDICTIATVPIMVPCFIALFMQRLEGRGAAVACVHKLSWASLYFYDMNPGWDGPFP